MNQNAYGFGISLWLWSQDFALSDYDRFVLMLWGGSSPHNDGKLKSRKQWLRREVHIFWDRLWKYNSKAGGNPTIKLDLMTFDFFLVKERAGQASAGAGSSGIQIFWVHSKYVDEWFATLTLYSEGLTTRPICWSSRQQWSGWRGFIHGLMPVGSHGRC